MNISPSINWQISIPNPRFTIKVVRVWVCFMFHLFIDINLLNINLGAFTLICNANQKFFLLQQIHFTNFKENIGIIILNAFRLTNIVNIKTFHTCVVYITFNIFYPTSFVNITLTSIWELYMLQMWTLDFNGLEFGSRFVSKLSHFLKENNPKINWHLTCYMQRLQHHWPRNLTLHMKITNSMRFIFIATKSNVMNTFFYQENHLYIIALAVMFIGCWLYVVYSYKTPILAFLVSAFGTIYVTLYYII